MEDPLAAWRELGGVGMATLDGLAAWRDPPGEVAFDALLVRHPGPAWPPPGAGRASARMPRCAPRQDVAADAVTPRTAGANLLGALVLGFAGLALFVAALVITNTFQVLIAQRTRTLALLRCVGAAVGSCVPRC